MLWGEEMQGDVTSGTKNNLIDRLFYPDDDLRLNFRRRWVHLILEVLAHRVVSFKLNEYFKIANIINHCS